MWQLFNDILLTVLILFLYMNLFYSEVGSYGTHALAEEVLLAYFIFSAMCGQCVVGLNACSKIYSAFHD